MKPDTVSTLIVVGTDSVLHRSCEQEMMQLSKEQKEQILAHRHIKLVSLARLVQERKELQARLKACNEATANPVENVPCLGLGAEFPHLLEVTERLNENVAQLHRSVCLFMGQIWRQVLPQATCTGSLSQQAAQH